MMSFKTTPPFIFGLIAILWAGQIHSVEIQAIPKAYEVEKVPSTDELPSTQKTENKDKKRLAIEPVGGDAEITDTNQTNNKLHNPFSTKCPNVDRAFQAATGLTSRAQRDSAQRILKRVMSGCPDPKDRLAILRKINELLGVEYAVPLIEEEIVRLSQSKQDKSNKVVKSELEKWLYGLHGTLATKHYEEKQYQASLEVLNPYTNTIEKNKSIGLGRLISENHKQLGNQDQAIAWRIKTKDWSKNNPVFNERDDAIALIWMYLERLDTASVTGLYSYATKEQKFVYHNKRANQLFDQEQYAAVLKELDKADANARSRQDRNHSLRAWSHFHLTQYKQANILFKAQYKKTASFDAAKGLFYTAVKLNTLTKILPEYKKDKGPMGDVYRDPFIKSMLGVSIKNTQSRPMQPQSIQLSDRNHQPEYMEMVRIARSTLAEQQSQHMDKAAQSGNIKEVKTRKDRIAEWIVHEANSGYARRVAAAYEILAGNAMINDASSNLGTETASAKANSKNSANKPTHEWLSEALVWRRYSKAWTETQISQNPTAENETLKEGLTEDILAMVAIYLSLNDLENVEKLERELTSLAPQQAFYIRQELNARYAQRAYNQKEFEQALEYLNTLSEYRPLTVKEQELMGWSYYQTEEYELALHSFTSAYKQTPESVSISQGLMFTAFQYDDLEYVAHLASEFHTSSPMLKNHFHDDNTFRLAKTGLDKRDAEISEQGIVSQLPQNESWLVAVAGLKINYRSGEKGTSELLSTRTPATRIEWKPIRGQTLWMTMDAVQLHTGTIPFGAEVGSRADSSRCPSGATPDFLTRRDCPRVQEPLESTDLMLEPHMGFSSVLGDWGWLDLHMGMTPMSSVIEPVTLGGFRLGVGGQDAGIQVGWKRLSVTDSLLSYTGQSDPYSQQEWGRVVENQGFIEGYSQVDDTWQLNFHVSHSQIGGKNVLDNKKNTLSGSIRREWQSNRKTRIRLGPELSYNGYEENLSGFTLWHGGYFSPQAMIKGTLNFDVIYQKQKSLLLKGSFYPGYQFQTENCLRDYTQSNGVTNEPCYRSSQNNQGVNAKVALGVLTKLKQSNHYAGADVQFSMSPNYNDWQIWLFWQYAGIGDDLSSLFYKAARW